MTPGGLEVEAGVASRLQLVEAARPLGVTIDAHDTLDDTLVVAV
jgi:hypothetical protein